jgi:hypothetical protein
MSSQQSINTPTPPSPWSVSARCHRFKVALIFGVTVVKSTVLGKWIGAVRLAAGIVTVASGVVVAYVGLSSILRDPGADLPILIFCILG